MNKKNIIRIVSAVIIVSLTVAGIVLGTKFDKTNLDKQAAAPTSTAAAENKTNSKDKEETKTSETQKTTTTNANGGSQSSTGNSQSQTTKTTQPATTAPATTKHTHNYSIKGETVAPTYDADGYTVYKCSCGATTKGDWVQKLQKPTGYTEADAIRFRNEIEAYAVSKGYQINRSLNADNSQWSAIWRIFDGNYDSRMAQAKSEIDGPFFSQGSWHTYINVIYYQVEDGMWDILPYTL